MYKCEIIADSKNPQGDRLTTYKVTYPRIIHAEFLRHRMLSRNTASSRAIPFEKMVKDVQNNPFVPIAWQKDHKGMQGIQYLLHTEANVEDWLKARDYAVEFAENLNNGGHGVTKQLCNRLLEPFVWTTELISGTEWDNFFELRCPRYEIYSYRGSKSVHKSRAEAVIYGDYDFGAPDHAWLTANESQAEIHIQKIAEMMYDAYYAHTWINKTTKLTEKLLPKNFSVPKQLQAGEWHIPYGDNMDDGELHKIFNNKYTVTQKDIDDLKVKIATARCARLSYQTLGDNPKIDYEADIKLHDRLLEQKHFSPFEHCARVMSEEEMEYFYVSDGPNTENFKSRWCKNFKGFIQYRHIIEKTPLI